jgi:hypothetical protein
MLGLGRFIIKRPKPLSGEMHSQGDMVIGLNVVQKLLMGLEGKNHDVLKDNCFSNVK